MNFIPEPPQTAEIVPFFEDARSEDGWHGHTTGKSIDVLKSEINEAVSRLGGMVVNFQRGTFATEQINREGFQITFIIQGDGRPLARGALDIAALPNKPAPAKSYEMRQDRALRMALYMARDILQGLWNLRKLSPGFVPLLPWTLEENSGKTFSQLWAQSLAVPALTVDGEFTQSSQT